MTENIHAYLTTAYNVHAYTHGYIFGYVEADMVYGAIIEDGSDLLPYITYVDRASSKNGGTYSLKYRPNKAQKALIASKASRIVAVCTEAYLEALKAEGKHNRGQIFENLVAEKIGATLETKPNLKFTEGGDLWYNGKAYQVKYNKATFTDERTLANL